MNDKASILDLKMAYNSVRYPAYAMGATHQLVVLDPCVNQLLAP